MNMVSPSELKKKEFTKSIKGYSPAEVDEYIAYLIANYSEAVKEYAELEKKYRSALEKIDAAKDEESAISALIVNAQKMADTIVNDANEKARAVTESVSDSCDKILSVYKQNVIAERNKLAEMEKKAVEFKESLYAAYRTHIEAIDKILPDEEKDSISDATEEELVDAAIDLASQKIKENSDDDVLPFGQEKESEDGENS